MTDSLWPEDSEKRPETGSPADGPDDPIAAFLVDFWQESKDDRHGRVLEPTDDPDGSASRAQSEPTTAEPIPEDSGPEVSEATVSVATEGEVPASTAFSGGAGAAPQPSEQGSADREIRPQPIVRSFEERFGSIEPEPPEFFEPGEPPSSPRRRPLFLISGVVLVIFAIALVWVGVKVVLDSNDGRLVTKIDDRSAPGFEAVVQKTQTGLVLMIGDDGVLSSATVVALGSETSGGVLSIPVETDVYVALGEGLVAPVALRELLSTSGTDTAAGALGELLNLTFTDVLVLRPADLARHVSTALTVNNPAAVTAADGSALFAMGSITLRVDDLWPFISAASPSEEPQVRAARQEAFWKAWLAAGDSDGVVSDGIDEYLSALADDQVTFQSLPVTEVTATDGQQARLRLAPGVTGAQAVAPIVPLPEGAPGRRPRLRVVDGTGQLDAAQGAAVLLAAGGGQVDIIGNSRLFGFLETQIVYYEDSQRAAAERMREILGVGEIVQSTQSNSALDLSITIGEDYLQRVGLEPAGAAGD